MIKPGKRTKAWNAARPKLKAEYLERGITYCEVGLPNCTGTNYLSFAHRYKRRDPRCEHSFEGTLLCCIGCHTVTEHFREITKMIQTGKDAQRSIQDYELTKYACYLIAQNGYPGKRAKSISWYLDNFVKKYMGYKKIKNSKK